MTPGTGSGIPRGGRDQPNDVAADRLGKMNPRHRGLGHPGPGAGDAQPRCDSRVGGELVSRLVDREVENVALGLDTEDNPA